MLHSEESYLGTVYFLSVLNLLLGKQWRIFLIKLKTREILGKIRHRKVLSFLPTHRKTIKLGFGKSHVVACRNFTRKQNYFYVSIREKNSEEAIKIYYLIYKRMIYDNLQRD